jgi:hypothetical protein
MRPGKRPGIYDPAIVLVNPKEEVTSESFLAWLDRRQQGSPVVTSVSAAETPEEIRDAGNE